MFEIMQHNASDQKYLKDLLITMSIGLVVGIMCAAFFKVLYFINTFHVQNTNSPYYFFCLPFLVIFLHFLKKYSLFFPTKVSEIYEWKPQFQNYWSPWMTPFYFLGTVLSHLFGASVGREGAIVVMSCGLISAFRLNWSKWISVLSAAGFSAVIGSPWVGLLFIFEMFSSSLIQKIYGFIAGYVACLVMQSFQIEHLFSNLVVAENKASFFETFLFIFMLSMTTGYLIRFYKYLISKLSLFFTESHLIYKIAASIVLCFLLFQPHLREFQSLSLDKIVSFDPSISSFQNSVIKLMLTLLSVTLGIFGGDFIPLLYSALHWGASLAKTLAFDASLGAYLCSYLFFAATTRLKWTSIFLILTLLGWGWFFWVYILVTLTMQFSGRQSLYKESDNDSKNIFNFYTHFR